MGPNDAPKPEKKQDAKELGVAFALKYYKGAIRGPDGVMELFGDNSVYVGTNGKEAHGLGEIRTAIGNLNLQDGKILVVSINAAYTGTGGIMVQSIANYITESSKQYGFSESFYLVSQSKGWYVRSCLFKWHGESPEDSKSKESPIVVEEEVNQQQQPNHELANGHTEDKNLAPEIHAEVTEEVKKPSDERKVSPVKDRPLTNGTSTPPSTPTTKNVATPQKDTKSPVASGPPSKAGVTPSGPPAPTSWAACVGGGVKSAGTNNANTNVKSIPAPTTTSIAASDVKSPTTNANGNTSSHAEGTQDRQNRHNKKPKAKSDFTVHVSKIIKGKKATEKDVVVDVTKAFEEFGPIAHVRVPGRRLADENETTLYAFVDFKEKEDFERMFADREQDNEGRVKLTIQLPVLQFDGEVIVAQNHDSRRNFYRNRRASDNLRPAANAGGGGNNARPGNNGRPPRNRRPSRNNGQSGNTRPPQTGNRNNSDNRRRENGTIKAKN